MPADPAIDPRIQRLQSTPFLGKRLTRRQIAEIQETVGNFPQLSRTELGQTLCEHLGWQTPRGRNRIQQATGVLDALEELGILTLPRSDPQPAIEGPLGCLTPLQLELVSGQEPVAEWNEWVQRHHPLG